MTPEIAIALVVLAAVVIILGIVLALDRQSQKLRIRDLPVQTKRRRIAQLDLSPEREKIMKRHNWDEAKASNMEAEYRDFLILLAENPDKIVSPWSNDLDLFWHEHILNTRKYAIDCDHIFGHLIQHDPHIEKDPIKHKETKVSTTALREAQLAARARRQQEAQTQQATTSSSGCSANYDLVMWGCSTEPSHAGTGHSSHDTGGAHTSDHSCGGHGGGHSCGGHSCSSGHSCGGHSCGGHSCGGGGCGGH